jgi:hypothetical protein
MVVVTYRELETCKTESWGSRRRSQKTLMPCSHKISRTSVCIEQADSDVYSLMQPQKQGEWVRTDVRTDLYVRVVQVHTDGNADI